MKRRRVWFWSFAVLLPIVIYAVIAERNSWRPHTYVVARKPDTIFSMVWQRKGQNVRLLIGNPDKNRARLEIWDMRSSQRVRQTPLPACESQSILTTADYLIYSPYYSDYGSLVPFSVRSLTTGTTRPLGKFETCLWAGDRIAGVKTGCPDGESQFCEFTFFESEHFKRTESIRIAAPGKFGLSSYEVGASNFVYGLGERTGAIGVIDPNKPANAVGNGTRRDILLFDARTGKHQRILPAAARDEEVMGLIWSEDNRYLYVFIEHEVPLRDSLYVIRRWDTITARWTARTSLKYLPATMGFSTDNTYMVILDYENHCTVYDAGTCKLLQSFTLPSQYGDVQTFDFSPDCRYLLVAQNYAFTRWRLR